MNNVVDWLEGPHVRESDAAPEVQQKGVVKVTLPLLPGLDPGSAAGHLTAPDVSEHNAAIHTDLGFSRSEIAEHENAGIFRGAAS